MKNCVQLSEILVAGQSQNSVANHFGKSKSVISRLVSRYQQTGGFKIKWEGMA